MLSVSENFYLHKSICGNEVPRAHCTNRRCGHCKRGGASSWRIPGSNRLFLWRLAVWPSDTNVSKWTPASVFRIRIDFSTYLCDNQKCLRIFHRTPKYAPTWRALSSWIQLTVVLILGYSHAVVCIRSGSGVSAWRLSYDRNTSRIIWNRVALDGNPWTWSL
jgi:hypothetical protein